MERCILFVSRFEENSSNEAMLTSTPQKPADANSSIDFRLNASKSPEFIHRRQHDIQHISTNVPSKQK